jgi:uroporphyrinogen-III synthase
VVVAPLMAEVALPATLPDLVGHALLFTSETGVRMALSLLGTSDLPAYCIGPRTAAVARRAGFRARVVGGDAATLVTALPALHPPPLVHLRGEDTTGNLAVALTAAGTPTQELVVYRQSPCPMPAHARRLLERPGRVIVPLFSPRSARLFGAEVQGVDVRADIRIAALSAAVADVIASWPATVAGRPDGRAMLRLVSDLFADSRLTSPADGSRWQGATGLQESGT